MSHFTTVKIQIKNGDILHQALVELGYRVECDRKVRGYQGNTTQADYVIRQSNGYDLGFRRSGETYDLIADFWGAKINQQQFVNAVTQKYAHKTLIKTAQEQGFNVEAEDVLEDGTVRVVVGRWV